MQNHNPCFIFTLLHIMNTTPNLWQRAKESAETYRENFRRNGAGLEEQQLAWEEGWAAIWPAPEYEDWKTSSAYNPQYS